MYSQSPFFARRGTPLFGSARDKNTYPNDKRVSDPKHSPDGVTVIVSRICLLTRDSFLALSRSVFGRNGGIETGSNYKNSRKKASAFFHTNFGAPPSCEMHLTVKGLWIILHNDRTLFFGILLPPHNTVGAAEGKGLAEADPLVHPELKTGLTLSDSLDLTGNSIIGWAIHVGI